MALEQNELDTIAALVEQYVGDTESRINDMLSSYTQVITDLDARIRGVESVVQQAIYAEFIRNEAIRLGMYVQYGPNDDTEIGAPHDGV